MKFSDRLAHAWNVLTKGPDQNIYNIRSHQTQLGLVDQKGSKKAMLEEYRSWAYAAVSIRAKAIAGARFRTFVKRPRLGDTEIVDHPLIELINHVNDYDTRYDLFFNTSAHLDLTGDAFWYLPLNRLGVPAEIWLLPVQHMKIIPSKDKFIAGYVLNYPEKQIPFDVDEVLHFKYPNPSDPYYGASPLMAAAAAVDIDQFSAGYQRTFYKNSAIPPFILETESALTETVYNRLKEQWHKEYGGEANSGKTAILEAGLKAKLIGFSPKDLRWTEEGRQTRDMILSVYGVPASKLGLVEDVNRANAEANDYTFAVNVTEPTLTMFDERITQGLAVKFDEKLIVKHDSTVPADEERKARVIALRLSAGWTSINEERVGEGYNPVDNGDLIRVPNGYTPLGIEPAAEGVAA